MSALQCLSLENLRAKLAQAIESRHGLMTGATSVSFTTGNGASRSVSRQQKLEDVEKYINELEAAINAKTGKGRGAGPMYISRARW